MSKVTVNCTKNIKLTTISIVSGRASRRPHRSYSEQQPVSRSLSCRKFINDLLIFRRFAQRMQINSTNSENTQILGFQNDRHSNR